MAKVKVKASETPEPMSSETLQAIVEGAVEEPKEEPKVEPVETPEKRSVGLIKMPKDLLVGSQRFSCEPHIIKTGVFLEIPEGGFAAISLHNQLAKKTRIRLAGNFLLFPEENGKEVEVVLENLGTDSFFLTKDTPLASYVIVNG